MSTKKIREALLSRSLTHDVSEALAEVEAIEKAAPAIVAGVQDMQTGMEPRPDFDKALSVIQAIAKECRK